MLNASPYTRIWSAELILSGKKPGPLIGGGRRSEDDNLSITGGATYEARDLGGAATAVRISGELIISSEVFVGTGEGTKYRLLGLGSVNCSSAIDTTRVYDKLADLATPTTASSTLNRALSEAIEGDGTGSMETRGMEDVAFTSSETRRS